MIFASFSDSFKYIHTADMFAALEFALIWSRLIIVQYNLFALFTSSAEEKRVNKLYQTMMWCNQIKDYFTYIIQLPNIWSIPNADILHKMWLQYFFIYEHRFNNSSSIAKRDITQSHTFKLWTSNHSRVNAEKHASRVTS